MKEKRIRVFLAILVCVTFMLAGLNVQAATTITSNQTGTDGLWYSFWTNGGGSVAMTLNGGGSYSVNWTNCGDFTCGKGWNTGSGHTITYSGSYSNSGGGACGIYGWTTNPLVEYYIADSWNGITSNSGTTQVGTVTTDGGTYTIYKHQQVNQPSIQGTATFWQYISVRNQQRVGGTITIQNHFNAWKNAGLNLGAMNYQILLTESWNGSGSANITVSEGGSSTTPVPTPTPGSGATPTPGGSGGTIQCESMTKSGQYTGNISSPFSGVALYANNDAVSTTQNFSTSTHTFALRGCSNNSNMARVDLQIDGQTRGTFYYGGSSPATYTLNNINTGTGSHTVKLVVTADTGAWDAYLDYLTIQ